MSQNFATIKSITDNVQSVLQGQGIKFSRSTFEDETAIPAALIPYGQIFYTGEDFEYTHGQRAGYAVGNFDIKVILQNRDATNLILSMQKWTHAIRDALTVNALNIVDLASSKLVSWVNVEGVKTEHKAEYGFMNFGIKIRYRET